MAQKFSLFFSHPSSPTPHSADTTDSGFSEEADVATLAKSTADTATGKDTFPLPVHSPTAPSAASAASLKETPVCRNHLAVLVLVIHLFFIFLSRLRRKSVSAKVLVLLQLLSHHFLVPVGVVLTHVEGYPSICHTNQATAQPRNPGRNNALVHRTYTVHPRHRPLTAPPPHATPPPPPPAPQLLTATKRLSATPNTNAHEEVAIFPNP